MGRTTIGCVMMWLVGCGGGPTREESAASRESRIEGAVVTTGAETRALAVPSAFDGVAGGPHAAQSLGEACVGWIPPAPQVEVDVASPATLSFRVTSDVDTTLVVVFPDGSVMCNDDSVGLDPRIVQNVLPGRYRVFVGTYDTGMSARFHLDVAPPPPDPPTSPGPPRRSPAFPSTAA